MKNQITNSLEVLASKSVVTYTCKEGIAKEYKGFMHKNTFNAIAKQNDWDSNEYFGPSSGNSTQRRLIKRFDNNKIIINYDLITSLVGYYEEVYN